MKINSIIMMITGVCLASCSSDEVISLETGDSFSKEGIGYVVIDDSNKKMTVEAVSCGGGDIVIPTTVEYGGKNYQVETVRLQKADQPVTSLTISEGVKTVERIAEGSGVLSIKKLVLPGSMMYVDDQFVNCLELEEVYLSEGIMRLHDDAFINARLRELHIPASLTEIGVSDTSDPGQFHLNVDRLETIDVADGNSVFDCGDRKNVLIHKPSQGLMTGNSSFYIPKGVKTICKYAFRWSEQYDKEVVIDIPEGVETIESWAFEAPRISSITIPASVKDVLAGAFRGDGLRTLKIAEGSEQLRFHDQYGGYARCILSYTPNVGLNLDEVYIGRNTQLFVLNAFDPSETMKLNTLKIGPKVTSLNWTKEEWTNGWSVDTIVSTIEKPDWVYPRFPENVFKNAELIVPMRTLQFYRSAEGWKEFSAITGVDPILIMF